MSISKLVSPLLLAALLTGAAEAQSSEQFDVVCTGTSVEATPSKAATKPWNSRISIDLAAAKYCPGGGGERCDAPLPIKAIEHRRPHLLEDIAVALRSGPREVRA